MTLGIARQAHLRQSAAGEKVFAQELGAIRVGADRFGDIAADQQHLGDAGEPHGFGDERLRLRARRDATGGHVRNGLEVGLAQRDQRLQHVLERVARQVIDVDGRAGRQQLGDAAGILRRVGAHLQRTARHHFSRGGSDTGRCSRWVGMRQRRREIAAMFSLVCAR